MKSHILLFILILSSSIQSKELDQIAIERRNNLLMLVNDEIKTIQQNQYSGPELKHRLFELFSEKIKLVKEKENETLLKTSIEEINQKGRVNFFKNSKEQYKNAQQFALNILKEYPKYGKKSEIYYAMAINCRDYGPDDDTEKLLKLSIHYARKNTDVLFNAKTALAEYYYNNKRYTEAISFYNDILTHVESPWYAKHLYNAGWCYLKNRQPEKALDLVKKSYEVSAIKKYVSVREQIIPAIGLFFVQADKTMEGVRFFEKNTSPSHLNLLNLAKSSMSKNDFNITEEVLKSALRDTHKRKNINDEMRVRLSELDIYRESKKERRFYETAIQINKLHLKNKILVADTSESINKIKDVAGFMQINLVKDKKKGNLDYNKKDYQKIITYFNILSNLDPKKTFEYRYYQGETALSTDKYLEALKFYKKAILNIKTNKIQDDIGRKSLEAMMVTLENAELAKKDNNYYTIFTFKNYLLLYPVSDKSQKIYQKLFSKYFETKNLNLATNTLLVYTHHYPKDDKIHREMLTQVLDVYIKKKETRLLAAWIKRIEKGFLNFPTEYIESSIAILGDLLFNKYYEMEKSGNVKRAIAGYESIYEEEKYPKKIKAQAAYALGTLKLENNDTDESMAWLEKSFENFSHPDLLKLSSKILDISKNFRLLQDFDNSSKVASYFHTKYCSESFKEKDDFFRIVNENTLITKKVLATTLSNNCNVSSKIAKEMKNESLKTYITLDMFDGVLKGAANDEDLTAETTQLIRNYLIQKYYQNPKNYREQILNLDSKFNLEPVVSHYEYIVDLVDRLNKNIFIFSASTPFNEDAFNSELEQYFSIIAELNKEALAAAKKSAPEEIFLIQLALNSPYRNLIHSIENYIPQGVNNQYLDGFKQGMRQITESLRAKSSQIEREKMAFLRKNNYFFETEKNAIFDQSLSSTIRLFKSHQAKNFATTSDFAPRTDERIVRGQ